MKKLLSLVAVLGVLGSFAFAQTEDTYAYVTFGEIDTLDPEGSYDTASWTAIRNIYETLYMYDGESINDYVPLLATDHQISEDGLTYTYNLREGVSFHSGNPLTCRDVEYSMERNLVMNDPSSGIWFFAESLLGTASNAADDESVTWELISNSVTCADDMTVEFNLPKVDPSFFGKLVAANGSIIDSAFAIENGEWDGTEATWSDWVGVDPREGFLHTNMSGTGAYQLINWDGVDLVAEAFDGYWGGAPSMQNVIIQVVDEQASRVLALQNGDADRISVNTWGDVESSIRGLDGVVVQENNDWGSVSVGAIHLNQNVVTESNDVNVGSGALDGAGIPADFFADNNVRLGFAYSFDPDEFIEELFLGNGAKLTMALPTSFLGYNNAVGTYSYDPEKAEEAFKAAFGGELWETGFEMTISYNTGNTTRQTIAEIFKANIEDLNPNFKINVRGIQWPDFLADRRADNLPISIVGWVPDYADSDNYIHTFYHSEGYYGALLDHNDTELDGLIDAARATTDQAERASLYEQVGQRGFDTVPFITYPNQTPFMVTRENLEGVYYNPMLSHFYMWKDVSKN